MDNNFCESKKNRSNEEKRQLINRLSRIEGQIRGLKNMIENDAYCADILVQEAAVSSALSSFGKALLFEHMRSCVNKDIREGSCQKQEELIALLDRLIK